MRIQIFSIICFLAASTLTAQHIKLNGNVNDTAAHGGLSNVILMALKFNDSSLVKYSRSNAAGIFPELVVPRDTYLVVLSHPSFSDKTYLLVPSPTDTAFRFKNVVMPPKSVVLNEVEIIAYKEKSYYKGDTLIFTADSFKTRPNATVEELLKKLPGFKVDAAGKITIQGKEVDQVLVDGDEFFGTDPTVATRNLNASSIANVQVYDKKNDNSTEGKDETLKVLNLQMKDDAKKGYFGKASVASDFSRFYENQLLLNRFRGGRKYSVFGLMANTPKQGFGGQDAFKYGLNNEQPWQYNDETGGWTSSGQQGTGIPQTIKAGMYYSDKFGKKTKLNTDYTFNQNSLDQGIETNTQFFLSDTTYTNKRTKDNSSTNFSHKLNLTFTHKIDSLTELTIAPKLRYSENNNSNRQSDDFITEEGINTRNTFVSTRSKNEVQDANVQVKLSRNFMKKDRNVTLSYQPNMNRSITTTSLNSELTYFQDQLPDSSVVQQRRQVSEKMEQNFMANYIEPITKKFKTELQYSYLQNHLSSSRNTYDIDAAANDLFNPLLSNSFLNSREQHRGGLRLIYDVKKYRVSLGSSVRNIRQENLNRSNGVKLDQNVTNILPNASFQYRISQGSNLQLYYNTSSQLPELQQMQPVIDNSDPNRLSLGNPDLKPTFNNNFNMNYYFFKGISNVSLWSGASFNMVDNQISSKTSFDSLGRAVTQPVNIDGNYFGNAYLGGNFPVFKKLFTVNYNINANTSRNVNIINDQKNVTENMSVGPSLSFEKDAKLYEVSIGGNYQYTVPKSTISTAATQPYYTYGLDANATVHILKKYLLSTDASYTNNGNRSPGYNLNYLIWNATVGRAFLKTENLIVTVNAYDILNQNISNQRNIQANQIVDTKTQIIKRYFLLKVMYKFNNQKTKVEDDDSY